jgi:hypothetical protein
MNLPYVLILQGMSESLPWDSDEDYSIFATDVERVVEKAVKDKAHIILFQEGPEDKTIPSIGNLLKGYKKLSIISGTSRSTRDRHLEILRELSVHKIQPEFVLFAGTNIEDILETIKGSLKFEEFPLIHLGPIHTFNKENFCEALEKLEKLENRNPEKVQISGDPYFWYETYKEEIEDENSN